MKRFAPQFFTSRRRLSSKQQHHSILLNLACSVSTFREMLAIHLICGEVSCSISAEQEPTPSCMYLHWHPKLSIWLLAATPLALARLGRCSLVSSRGLSSPSSRAKLEIAVTVLIIQPIMDHTRRYLMISIRKIDSQRLLTLSLTLRFALVSRKYTGPMRQSTQRAIIVAVPWLRVSCKRCMVLSSSQTGLTAWKGASCLKL